MKRLVSSLVLVAVLVGPFAAFADTCKGADPCKACKSCKDCAYCKDGKATCGACKDKPPAKKKKDK